MPEVVVDLGDISRRLHELAENLKLIIDGTDEHYVYSLQVNRRLRAGGESMTAERIDIGEALATEWLPEVHTAIFASATMTVSKSFEHFNHAVGLDRIGASTSSSLHLDSSYDFDSNMAVVVAGDIPDPRDRESYLSALERVLVDAHLAMGGSVLTLFTNRRDMEELYARVEPKIARAGLELNCQQRNSSPRRLRDRFINEPTSSLFALKAFWEGFDASGETLRCVIIPKLPFSSPTDPLSCERNLREDRAWARYSLPRGRARGQAGRRPPHSLIDRLWRTHLGRPAPGDEGLRQEILNVAAHEFLSAHRIGTNRALSTAVARTPRAAPLKRTDEGFCHIAQTL